MDEVEDQDSGMKRGLKDRRTSMTAMGGCIGIDLFMTSGGAIHDAGTLGTLAAYAIIGAMVFFLVTSLGETATYLPVSDSFSTYATRFVGPSLGFALGWNCWFNWVVTVTADITIAAQVVQYWAPMTGIPTWVWSCVFIVTIFALNSLSVRVYGESECWFALIKVITVIVFIIIGILTISGIVDGHFVGFETFTKGDGPILGGSLSSSLLSIPGVFLVAGFSFQGIELIGITAGGSENPEHTVPKAIRRVFWRILLFYILAIFVIGMLIPYNSNALVGGDNDVTVSPFTLVFKNAGLAFTASFMSVVILASALSAGNSGMYALTRMLYSMSRDKLAFASFSKTNKHGVPYLSLIATGVLVIVVFLIQRLSGSAYEYIVAASGMTGFIAWVGIAVSHYHFGRAFNVQHHRKSELKYEAKWFPFGPIFAGILCIIVIVGQDVDFIRTGYFDLSRLIAAYTGIPVFLVFSIYHKLRYKTRKTPLEEIGLSQDVSMNEVKHH